MKLNFTKSRGLKSVLTMQEKSVLEAEERKRNSLVFLVTFDPSKQIEGFHRLN